MRIFLPLRDWRKLSVRIKGVLLNKSYEELKKKGMIGVACAGGVGDEFCNNFKTTGSIDMIKQAFSK